MQLSPGTSHINRSSLYSCSLPCLCRAQVHRQQPWLGEDARRESEQLHDLLSMTSQPCRLHPPAHASPVSVTRPGDRQRLCKWEGGERASPQPRSAQPCLDFYWAIQKHACLHRVIAFCCGRYKIHWKHVWLEGHIKLLHLSVHFFALFCFDLTGQRRHFNEELWLSCSFLFSSMGCRHVYQGGSQPRAAAGSKTGFWFG